MSHSGDKSLRGSQPGPTDTPEAIETSEMVEVASFGAPHGVGGEMRIFDADLNAALFESGETLWVRARHEWRALTVVQVRQTPKHGIAEFEEIEGRNEAAELRNKSVYVPLEALPEPAEGEFYQADLQGRSVYMPTEPEEEIAVESCRRIGEVGGFFETNGANDVMVVVLADGEELFVPMIEGAVAPVNNEADHVVVYHPSRWGPEGMEVPAEAPGSESDGTAG